MSVDEEQLCPSSLAQDAGPLSSDTIARDSENFAVQGPPVLDSGDQWASHNLEQQPNYLSLTSVLTPQFNLQDSLHSVQGANSNATHSRLNPWSSPATSSGFVDVASLPYPTPQSQAMDAISLHTLMFSARGVNPSKGQRVSQACQACRKRKAKCSGERPICQRCSDRGLSCEYTKDRRQYRTPSTPRRQSSADLTASASPPATHKPLLSKGSALHKNNSVPMINQTVSDSLNSTSLSDAPDVSSPRFKDHPVSERGPLENQDACEPSISDSEYAFPLYYSQNERQASRSFVPGRPSELPALDGANSLPYPSLGQVPAPFPLQAFGAAPQPLDYRQSYSRPSSRLDLPFALFDHRGVVRVPEHSSTHEHNQHYSLGLPDTLVQPVFSSNPYTAGVVAPRPSAYHPHLENLARKYFHSPSPDSIQSVSSSSGAGSPFFNPQGIPDLIKTQAPRCEKDVAIEGARFEEVRSGLFAPFVGDGNFVG